MGLDLPVDPGVLNYYTTIDKHEKDNLIVCVHTKLTDQHRLTQTYKPTPTDDTYIFDKIGLLTTDDCYIIHTQTLTSTLTSTKLTTFDKNTDHFRPKLTN